MKTVDAALQRLKDKDAEIQELSKSLYYYKKRTRELRKATKDPGDENDEIDAKDAKDAKGAKAVKPARGSRSKGRSGGGSKDQLIMTIPEKRGKGGGGEG